MGLIKKFQCQHCQGIVETEFDDEYVICGHCDSACQVPKEFGAGSVIDDFLVVKLLGEGGMGNVYLAHQFSLDRKVALKILKDDFMKDPKFKDEFIYEARNVACLNHPNIIQAYKVGEEGGMVFFAMEYVEGRNLKDILREEGAINEKLAISIAMEIVAALGYAWNLRKLVHRDIKPENIMMTNDGTAKLMDLGLSLRDGDDKDEGDMIAGTPQYISPEQVLGTEMDIRGDFYCLGATLYHLVSGKMPFEGNLQQIVKSHLSEKPPSLRKIVPGIDDFFAKIIHKMMAKKPENRYENAEALLTAFRKDMKLIEDAEHGKKHFKITTQTNIKTATQTSSFVQRKKRKDPLLVASMVMLALLLGGFFLIRILMGGGSNQVKTPQKTLNKEPATKITTASKRTPVSSSDISQELTAEQKELNKGLYYSYYNVEIDKDGKVVKEILKTQRQRQQLFSKMNRPSFYKLVFEGFITMPYSETYKFYLKADDKITVHIDGKLLGSSGGTESSFNRTLDKGTYPIKIEYYQHTKSHNISLEVESISVDRKKVPSEWFTLSNINHNLEIDPAKPGLDYALYRRLGALSQKSSRPADKVGTTATMKSIIDSQSINCGLSFNALLKVPKPGKYTLYLSANTRANLYVNQCYVLRAASPKTSSREIFLASDINEIQIDYIEKVNAKELKLEIESEDLPRQEIPDSWYFQNTSGDFQSKIREEKLKAYLSSTTKGSLMFEFFKGGAGGFGSLNSKKANQIGVASDLSVTPGGAKENFFLRYTGKIDIPEAGKYSFHLGSDDNCDVYIKGQKVVSADAGSGTKSGDISLTKGQHDFKLLYKQGVGDKWLKLSVSSNIIPETKVPSHWFSLPEGVSMSKETPKTTQVIEEPKKANKEKGQLRFNYYETAWKKDIEKIIEGPVISSGIEPDLNPKKGKRDELYGLYYYGYINIPSTREYSFYMAVDDFGLLKIDGKNVIGKKAGDDKGPVKHKLKAGKHKFELFYYQNTHNKRILIQIEAEGIIKRQRIPSSWYSIDEDKPSNSIEPVSAEIGDSFDPGLRYTLYKSGTEVENMDEMLKNKVIKKDKRCGYLNHVPHSHGHANNYGLVYEGYIYLDVDKTHTFGLTSNDGSRLYLNDKLVIDNDGTHEAKEKTATLTLKKGLYKLRIEYFQQLQSRELIFSWKNKAGQMVPIQEKFFYRKKDIKVTDIEPAAAMDRKLFENGLKYSLYKSDKPLKNIEQMLGSKLVTKDAVTDVVDIVKDAGKYKEDYGLVYEGFIKVESSGERTFSVMSNDDTRLYLGGELIIDNDRGRKSDVAKIKKVNLSKGMYEIRIVYYQDNADRHLDLRWNNEAGKMVHVHGHRLYIKK